MTVVAELEAARAEIATLKSASDVAAAVIEKGKLELAVAVKAQADAVAALDAEKQAYVASKTESDKAMKAEQDAHAVTKTALETAQKKMVNPAFQDASVKGSEKPAVEGGADAGKTVLTKAEALVEYNKINDPAARARFRTEHKNELGL